MFEKPFKTIKVGEGKATLSEDEVKKHQQTEKIKERVETRQAGGESAVHEISEKEIEEGEEFVEEVKEKGDKMFV